MIHEQNCKSVLMIKPFAFGFNEETAKDNHYQKNDGTNPAKINERALKEFDDFAAKLKQHHVDVHVFHHPLPGVPDALFPNNWISFPGGQKICLYPMYAKSRRLERHPQVIASIKQTFPIKEAVDFSAFEKENAFCEGTGSLIFDHKFKIAYACLSERTSPDLTSKICKDLNYSPVLFRAYQSVGSKRLPIYHTNVIMSVGESFIVICLSAIDDKKERQLVENQIAKTGKQVIEITEDQVNAFCGNILEVLSKDGKKIIVMSEQAEKGFTQKQLADLSKQGSILSVPLHTIETYGGGSARCMLCEVF